MASSIYSFLADVVALVHGLYAGFIVVALLLVLIGYFCKWEWVRNPWFRIIHLVMILIVVVQSWLGIVCPLTTLEAHLRTEAGQGFHDGSPFAQFLHALLFFDAPWWVFTLCYTLCGLLVVASFVLVPLRFRTACPEATEGTPGRNSTHA